MFTAMLPAQTPISRQHNKKLVKIIQALLAIEESAIFRKPIPHKALGWDDYKEIVKKPIDLNFVRRQYNEGKYKFVEEVLDEIQLIWENVFRFGKKEHESYDMAFVMQKNYDQLLSDYLPEYFEKIDRVAYLEQFQPKKVEKKGVGLGGQMRGRGREEKMDVEVNEEEKRVVESEVVGKKKESVGGRKGNQTNQQQIYQQVQNVEAVLPVQAQEVKKESSNRRGGSSNNNNNQNNSINSNNNNNNSNNNNEKGMRQESEVVSKMESNLNEVKDLSVKESQIADHQKKEMQGMGNKQSNKGEEKNVNMNVKNDKAQQSEEAPKQQSSHSNSLNGQQKSSNNMNECLKGQVEGNNKVQIGEGIQNQESQQNQIPPIIVTLNKSPSEDQIKQITCMMNLLFQIQEFETLSKVVRILTKYEKQTMVIDGEDVNFKINQIHISTYNKIKKQLQLKFYQLQTNQKVKSLPTLMAKHGVRSLLNDIHPGASQGEIIDQEIIYQKINSLQPIPIQQQEHIIAAEE